MKLAVAGKGGVGKTTISAWLGNWLAEHTENTVWMIDADTATSLGLAMGFEEDNLPTPLVKQRELIHDRIGSGLISLNPVVDDLPDKLAVSIPSTNGSLQLLVMGGISSAGSGCACGANVLSKEIIEHVTSDNEYIIVDLEAGIEHLGRGTIAAIDGLIIVTEPSQRSIYTAKKIASFAKDLGIENIGYVINRAPDGLNLNGLLDPDQIITSFPILTTLMQRQLHNASVLNLDDQDKINSIAGEVINYFNR